MRPNHVMEPSALDLPLERRGSSLAVGFEHEQSSRIVLGGVDNNGAPI